MSKPGSRGKIPVQLLQKIKDAANIIEIVGEHVVLRKSGSNHTGLCPFHSERTPSFSVSEQKQLYHCYGCKRGGDLITFVMEIHGITFPEAVEELADRYKIALPQDWKGESGEEDPEAAKRRAAAREKLALAYKLNRFAAAFYHQSLPKHPDARDYFERRGVTQADLHRGFYLGAAPNSWDGLASFLVAKKAPLPLAVELGLIRPSQKSAPAGGCGYFDLFRNRAIFPILDLRGKVAGFGGRALGDDTPKYLNSPESALFQKSKLAYGLYQAQKHVRERDEVILVEGYFDVLAMHAAGFENTVATCGTALTPDHLALFRRLGKKITVLFDGDKAGISATERAMEVGLEQGLVLYGASIPDGLDPDELLLAPGGKERMAGLLAAAKPLLDSRIEQAREEARGGPEARTQALKMIAGWLARFRDPVGREVRLDAAARELGVSRQLIEKAGAGSQGRNAPAPGSVSPAGRPSARVQAGGGSRGKAIRLPTGDKLILQALARGAELSELIAKARASLPAGSNLGDLFEYPPARDFAASLSADPLNLQKVREAPDDLLTPETDPQVRAVVIEEAVRTTEAELDPSEVRLALDRSVRHAWERFAAGIRAAATQADAQGDAELHAKLLQELLGVQRRIKELASAPAGEP